MKVKYAVFFTLICCCINVSGNAYATTLKVTISNNAQVNGLSFTPVFSAFHSDVYNAFDLGGSATDGLKALAELGMVNPIASELAAADPGATSGVVFPEAGARPLFPGESGEIVVDVDDPETNRFFTFLSMLLPSNDTFFGNSDPVELFNIAGEFLGTQVLNITGANLYDAGTEGLDTSAAPFVAGSDATSNPADTSNLIRGAESLADFGGLSLGNGSVLDASLIDFLTDHTGFDVATITITEVPEPSAAMLLILGLGGLLTSVARNRSKRAI